MKKEDKELLLKDLCARLPYGVKLFAKFGYEGDIKEIVGRMSQIDDSKVLGISCDTSEDYLTYYVSICEVKPYLFPISSMTSEQLFEVNQIIDEHAVEIRESFLDIIDSEYHVITYLEILGLLEWFYKNHFDICGLIPKGLAKDATGLNIY